MEYMILVVLHLCGAMVWIGALVATLFGLIPYARRSADLRALQACGSILVGKIGLAALVLQILTGARLAMRWINWGTIFSNPTPAGHLILTKIVLLVIVLVLAGHAYHRRLPRLTPEKIGAFNALTWVLTVLSLLTLIAGAGLRTGGLH